jgi:hypothetical protein
MCIGERTDFRLLYMALKRFSYTTQAFYHTYRDTISFSPPFRTQSANSFLLVCEDISL